MRWLWREAGWVYGLLIFNAGVFAAPIYWAYRTIG